MLISASSGPSKKCSSSLTTSTLILSRFSRYLSICREPLFRAHSKEDCNLPPPSPPPPLVLWWAWPCRSDVQRRPFQWRRSSVLHTFWFRLERRTLQRGPVSDRFWHSVDRRFFNVHVCLTLESHTRFPFSGERKVCDSTHSQSESEKTAPQTTFTFGKRTCTTSTDGRTTSTHRLLSPSNPQHHPPQNRDRGPG